MKMTPEQEAYFAYGYARRKVYEAKEMLAADRQAKKYGKLKNAQNALSCGKFMLKAAIHEAWQKRAACRRTCMTCNHFGDRNISCRKCKASGEWVYPSTRAYCHYFEPRKEGE